MRCAVKDKTKPVIPLSPKSAAHLGLGEQAVRHDFVNAIRFKQVGDAGLYGCIGRTIDQFRRLFLRWTACGLDGEAVGLGDGTAGLVGASRLGGKG